MATVDDKSRPADVLVRHAADTFVQPTPRGAQMQHPFRVKQYKTDTHIPRLKVSKVPVDNRADGTGMPVIDFNDPAFFLPLPGDGGGGGGPTQPFMFVSGFKALSIFGSRQGEVIVGGGTPPYKSVSVPFNGTGINIPTDPVAGTGRFTWTGLSETMVLLTVSDSAGASIEINVDYNGMANGDNLPLVPVASAPPAEPTITVAGLGTATATITFVLPPGTVCYDGSINVNFITVDGINRDIDKRQPPLTDPAWYIGWFGNDPNDPYDKPVAGLTDVQIAALWNSGGTFPDTSSNTELRVTAAGNVVTVTEISGKIISALSIDWAKA